MTIPLNAKAILDSTEFQHGVEGMRSSGKSASGDIASSFSAMGLSSIATFLSLSGVIAETVKILGDCTKEAAEDETIMTRLSVTLTDMGRTGDISASGLEKTAMNLQTIAGINHDDILQAYNAIARFENLDTTAMDQIVKDAIDMFAGGEGGSVAENANAIARVLETGVIPRTWGFSFALKAAIQDEVKAGDTTKALADTLGTLEQRFGGQAAAQMKTEAGQARLLAADFKTLEEEIGQKLLPTELKLVQFADLIITAQGKIDNALKVHEAETQKTSKTYEDYALEMLRVKFVSQGVSEQDAITRAQHALTTYGLEDLAKAYNITSEEMYGYIKAAQGMDGPDAAFLRFLDNAKPGLDDTPTALAAADKAVVNYAADLADALGVVKDNTAYTKNLADAEKQLADDTAAGWGKNSQKIKDDKTAINDLKAAHHTAMLQMQVDLFQYGLTLDGTFDAADQQRILDYELKLGLLTQADYDEATAILKRKDALDKLPTDWSATYKTYWMTYYITNGTPPPSGDPTNPNPLGGGTGDTLKKRRSDYPPGATGDRDWQLWLAGGGQTYQAGTAGWQTVPGGYPNDTYPIRLTSGEKFNVIPAGNDEAGGGGGIVLNNYGTLLFPEGSNVKADLLRQLR